MPSLCPPFSRRRHPRSPGFSLIELLAVVAIMGILAGVIGFAVIGGGGATTPAGQRTLSSLLGNARNTAILRRAPAYLVIYKEGTTAASTDPEKQYRYLGVVFKDVNDSDDDGDTTELIAASDGVYLPQGVYFVPASAATNDVTVAPEAPDNPGLTNWPPESAATAEIRFTWPGTTEDETWLIYGFDPNGQTITLGPNDEPGLPRAARLVLSPGRPNPSGGVEITNPLDSLGIFVRPNGGTVMINDYEELDAI